MSATGPKIGAEFRERFVHPDGSPLDVRRAGEDDLTTLERTWAGQRSPATAHWSWIQIAQQSCETLVVHSGTQPVALFSTERAKLLQIEKHRLYCLSFLEVAPELRGKGMWGPVAVAMAAGRASALGADGLALPVRAGLEAWYARLGAVPVSKYKWKVDKNLVALKLVGEPFDDMVEAFRGSEARSSAKAIP